VEAQLLETVSCVGVVLPASALWPSMQPLTHLVGSHLLAQFRRRCTRRYLGLSRINCNDNRISFHDKNDPDSATVSCRCLLLHGGVPAVEAAGVTCNSNLGGFVRT